jgi:hypothetical protein
MECLTGQLSGSIAIGNISQSNPRKYGCKCVRPGCHSSWDELHSHLVTLSQAGLTLQCRNVNCFLNRLPVERPKPLEPQLTQSPAQPALQRQLGQQRQLAAPPSPDAYRTYANHAIQFDWTQIVNRETFEGYSARGRAFLQDGMDADLIRKRQQDAPGTRGDIK